MNERICFIDSGLLSNQLVGSNQEQEKKSFAGHSFLRLICFIMVFDQRQY